jgi:hypothetical protein
MKPVEIAHRSLLAASVLGLLALAVPACSNPPDEDQTTPPEATTPAMASPDDVPGDVETAVDDVKTRGFCFRQNIGKMHCVSRKAYVCGGCFDNRGRPEKLGIGRCDRQMWTRWESKDFLCDRPR